MPGTAHFFGIRHHGPGSARRLIEALDALQPACVLIEGPSDVSDLLPFLADPGMQPPVALLAYAADDPSNARFWPFARFSPEYQAALWALKRAVPVRFIDLPVSWRLPVQTQAETSTEDAAEPSNPPPADDPIARDPIGVLASAAGYEDGESWWSDVIEENPDPGPIFSAIADAMGALRAESHSLSEFEAAREAHMRLEIAQSEKDIDGAIAVVCGAWHVPALKEKRTQKEDKARLKDAPKRKIAATWAPWTAQRLAYESGYGAGLPAPGWCLHLWERGPDTARTAWLTRIAAALRESGHTVSTASIIEAERLSVALAALRGRPAAGFEEMREAAIACFCHGEAMLWATIERTLLIGKDVGEIPDGMPLAPLLEDLKRQQSRTKLKPEALEREVAVDLRTESGLDRSTLLHRLNVLGVPWGVLGDAGRSRGSFRERWTLAWKPEFAVELVENLVYGSTIEAAANAKLSQHLLSLVSLRELAETTHAALTAQLSSAAEAGLSRLSDRAGSSSDCGELLAALPPLADIVRYGQARQTDTAALTELFQRIAIGGAIALPYAARNLDVEAALKLSNEVRGADAALTLIEANDDITKLWQSALTETLNNTQTAPRLAGAAARLLYANEALSPEDAAQSLSRHLSPSVPTIDAAAYFEGFFEGGGENLIHDAGLRSEVDMWMQSLGEDDFIEMLPLLRRTFSALDKMQRKRLLDSVMGRAQTASLTGLVLQAGARATWPAHEARILSLLRTEPQP